MSNTSKAKRWIMIACIGVGCLAAAFVAVCTGYPVLVRRAVRRTISRWEKRIGRKISHGKIRAKWGTVTIENIEIKGPSDCAGAPLFTAASVRVKFDPRKVLLSGTGFTEAIFTRPRICLIRYKDGRNNIGDVIRKVLRRPPRRARRPKRILLKRGSLTVRDRLAGYSLTAPLMDARVKRSGQVRMDLSEVVFGRTPWPSGLAKKIRMEFHPSDFLKRKFPTVKIAGGRLQLHRRLMFTEIDGRVGPSEKNQGLELELKGSYGGATEKLWKASGWIAGRSRAAELDVVARRFTLDKLTAFLRTGWGRMVVDPSRAHVDAALHIGVNESVWKFKGHLALSGLSLRHWRLSRHTVEDVGFRGELQATMDTRAGKFTVHRARLKRAGVTVDLNARLTNLGNRPRVLFSIRVPPVPCSRFLAAVPRGLLPRLKGFRLTGEFSMNVDVAVDFRYLTADSVNVDADVNYRRCRFVAAPFPMSVSRLKRPFMYRATDGRVITEFEVGPANPNFVPLDSISRHVVNSILTTEDSRFFRHRGFIYHEFRSALARNLIARRFRYGASSITMQMVKNVLLNREKNLSRKFQELVLTAYVESGLSKRRIIEIYLNVIEFGPGIYGIGNAARHYFDKPAALIEPQEAAFLSTLLPNPKKRFIHFCRGQVATRWRRWVDRILNLMYKRNRLTPQELQAALAAPIQFSRRHFDGYSRCKGRIRRYVSGGRPTPRPRHPR